MSDGLSGFERLASVSSVKRLLDEHAPGDGEVLVNRVGNLNIYSIEGEWLGTIYLTSASLVGKDDPLPDAEWEAVA